MITDHDEAMDNVESISIGCIGFVIAVVVALAMGGAHWMGWI